MGGLFVDDEKPRSEMAFPMIRDMNGEWKRSGPPTGVAIYLTCPECSSVSKVHIPWNEVTALLNRQQVVGVVPDGNGWHSQVYCGKNSCQTLKGRTFIRYRIYYDDLKRHFDNFRAGR